jgi:hypothetical protein
MKYNLSFELLVGQNFVAIKTGKKIFKISVKGFCLKFSEINIDDFLKPVKVRANNGNR